MSDKFATLPEKSFVEETIAALEKNNISAEFVMTSEEAKEKVLSLIPEGSEVMNMSSVTLDTIGVSEAIMDSGKYTAVKKELMGMDREKDNHKMQQLGAAPIYAVGSVQAVTTDGKVVIASNTGSQLPSYAYGSAHVILVVGIQKIVHNLDEAMKRIYEYVLPLESVRLNKQYNINTGSYVSKILIINREFTPKRLHLIFVNENLGF
jgi:L-lactate utilization protein LutC